MALTPVFVTQYEILRSSDYVLVTLSAPTGEVQDGRMGVQEVQRIALTYPRFLELTSLMAQIAGNMTGQPAALARKKPDRGGRAGEDEADVPAKPPGDWVIRH